MYPHERSLVKRMQDKPFVLIGVNSDSKERVEQAIRDNNITWRSFWDGGSTGGPIASAWHVRGWPTIYVIDDRGVIRFKNIRGDKLDEAVDTLIERAIATLVADLESDEPAVRSMAAFRMGRYGAPDAKEHLTELLEDSKPLVRRRAAVGLALAGEPADALLPLLRKAATDRESDVRVAALEVLGKAGDKRSTGLAIRALKDDAVEVRRAAVAAIGLLKPPSAAGVLAGAVSDPDTQTAKAAALALGALQSPKSRAKLKKLAAQPKHPARVWIAVAMHQVGQEGTGDRFAALLNDPDQTIRRQAIHALAELSDFDATDLYIRALENEDQEIFAVAKEALADSQDPRVVQALKESEKRQIDRLVSALAGQDYRKRGKAFQAIRQLGPDAAVPLLGHLETVPSEVRGGLAFTIARWRNADVATPVAEKLKDAELDPSLRRCYETILGRLGRKAGRVALELAGDKDAAVRESGVRLLLRHMDAEATEVLKTALDDKAERVQVYAAFALSRAKDEDALAVVQQAVASSDAEVRRLAVTSLANYDAQVALPSLLKLTDDNDRGIRVALVDAMSKFKDREATEAIVAIMDKDASFRKQAMRALRRQDTPDAARALGRCLDSDDAALQRDARYALASMGTPEAKKILESEEE